MNKRRILYILGFVVITMGYLYISAPIAYADNHTANNSTNETDTAPNISYGEVLSIISNPRTGFDEYQDVREWWEANKGEVELTDRNRQRLDEYLRRAGNNDRSVDTDVSLSGSQRISDDVRVTGYQFDQENETVQMTIQSDYNQYITITDVGAQSNYQRFTFQSIQLDQGEQVVTADAQYIQSDGIQAVAISDNDEGVGNVVTSGEPSKGYFETLKWWYVPTAVLVAVAYLAYKAKSKIEEIKNRHKGDIVPVE